jgi:hypothetical protein
LRLRHAFGLPLCSRDKTRVTPCNTAVLTCHVESLPSTSDQYDFVGTGRIDLQLHKSHTTKTTN